LVGSKSGLSAGAAGRCSKKNETPTAQANLRSLRKLGCFGRGFYRETAPNYFRFGGVNQNRSPQVAASFQVSWRFCCQLATIAAKMIPLLHPNIPQTQPVGPAPNL
jgi:hypothetical protein